MRTLNDIAAAIFDIDGTLLDSSGIWEHLGEDFLLRRGIAPQSGLAGILAPMTMEESCRFLRENYHLQESTGDIRTALLSIISEFYRK
jgi:beta-phosphoglucomutase-like phosphatase (HAD superfamily)